MQETLPLFLLSIMLIKILHIQWVPGVKWPGRAADHSPPSSSKVKNVWHNTSTPIQLHGTVVKHRDNFTFYICLCILPWLVYNVI
jgi:hypothetical protein